MSFDLRWVDAVQFTDAEFDAAWDEAERELGPSEGDFHVATAIHHSMRRLLEDRFGYFHRGELFMAMLRSELATQGETQLAECFRTPRPPVTADADAPLFRA